jgi:hypothetical protein
MVIVWVLYFDDQRFKRSSHTVESIFCLEFDTQFCLLDVTLTPYMSIILVYTALCS